MHMKSGNILKSKILVDKNYNIIFIVELVVMNSNSTVKTEDGISI